MIVIPYKLEQFVSKLQKTRNMLVGLFHSDHQVLLQYIPSAAQMLTEYHKLSFNREEKT